ncbi:SOSB2 protein, partial [Rhynochetos jubatus]|nr:SOSB2 protein [Rhynochetos jubatus]
MSAASDTYHLIKDIKPGLKNLNVIFIVLEIGKWRPARPTPAPPTRDPRGYGGGKAGEAHASTSFFSSGSLTGTALLLSLPRYASLWKGCLTLYTGRGGELHKIGEFCMVYSEVPNFSEPNSEHIGQNKLAQGEQNNSSASSNMGSCTFGPLGNGLQTGPESSGFPFTYNHGHTYAGSGRGSGRGPVNPAPANSVQPPLPAVSNGRDPRRAFKR